MAKAQGIRLWKSDFTKYGEGAEDALTLLVEHMRYAGIARDEGESFIVWGQPGIKLDGPVERIRTFLQRSELVVE